MSDMSQGPGWWQASDGKWYPPEQAPGAQQASYGAPNFGAGGVPGGAVPAGGQLAEWPQRVVAWLIDAVCIFVLYIAVFILAAIFGAISDALGAIVFILGYLGAIVLQFWFAYLNGVKGQSPGKAVTGLKVVSEADGSLIGGGTGIVRAIAHFLDGIVCGLGYLLPLFDEKKQTIADKVMKTVVLANQEKKPFGPDIFKP
jgi:uncharacterized RDD family membrane protein YckC